MMLSIELVPRDADELVAQAGEVLQAFPQFEWLNIPDIKALPVRSHDAAAKAVALPVRVIPHVRARDRSLQDGVALLRGLVELGVKDALIVTGDRFDQGEEASYVTSVELIRAGREAGLPLQLWAAFDPYRGEMRAEFEYVQAKLDAGAAGLFTQPFFDVRLAQICLDQLDGVPTFLGISPVTTPQSRRYWERTNRVVFPSSFEPTLEYCARLSADLLDVVEAHGQHAYLMPIKVDPLEYVEAVFAERRSARTVG